jgi:4-hydroxy-tetrahydrodipicolinate synthase
MADRSIEGVCPIVVTPFREDGSVDFDSFGALCETLLAGGSDALALFGYASEFFKLTDDERERLAEILIERCDRLDHPSVVSVTAQSTHVAVQEARQFESMGADALMVLPPYERSPPQSAIYEHLLAVANAVDVPIVVQYAPGSTGIQLPPSFFADLYADAEAVEYFKIECDPAGPYITTLLEETNEEPGIFVGRAGYEMIDAYDRGAVGVMPASAMFDIYVQIHRAYHNGDRSGAIEIHRDLVTALNQFTRIGLPFEKEILQRRGIIESAANRDPVAGFDTQSREQFEQYYERFVEPHFSPIPA